MLLARAAMGPRGRFVGVLHSPAGGSLLARLGQRASRHFLFNTHQVHETYRGRRSGYRTGRVLTPVATDLHAAGAGRPDGAASIVMVGRLQEYKGHLDFVRMAEAVHRAHPSAVFTAAGAPSPAEPLFLERLREEVRERGLDGVLRLEVSPETARLHELLRAATVYVHPAVREDFGISIVEAMSAGLPVVGYETEGAQILLQGPQGVVVRPRSAEALAQAVLDVLGEPADAYARRRAAALAVAREHVYGPPYEARVADTVRGLVQDLRAR
jgi:glycosyltransferase involved in cell wall biosynthesis